MSIASVHDASAPGRQAPISQFFIPATASLQERRPRTGDVATINRLLPNIEAALTWIDEHGDRDGDGFVEYGRLAFPCRPWAASCPPCGFSSRIRSTGLLSRVGWSV